MFNKKLKNSKIIKKMTVADESQKLGLSFGLITTLLVLCAVFRKCCCCRTRDYSMDLENQYHNMSVEKKKKYVMFFGMMYMMVLVNYLSEVIYMVANDKN